VLLVFSFTYMIKAWKTAIPRYRPSIVYLSSRSPVRPTPIQALQTRKYARYSRFEEDEGGRNGGKPEDPIDREFRKRFEFFRLYGTAAIIMGGGTLWYIFQ
jgi:hypothetical protein